MEYQKELINQREEYSCNGWVYLTISIYKAHTVYKVVIKESPETFSATATMEKYFDSLEDAEECIKNRIEKEYQEMYISAKTGCKGVIFSRAESIDPPHGCVCDFFPM